MKRLISLYSIFLALVSCSQIEPEQLPVPSPEVVGEIYVPETEILTPVLPSNGGSVSIVFSATAAWTAEIVNGNADAWCSISPASGEAGTQNIVITATENTNLEDRNATIELRCDKDVRTIVVTQKQKNALSLTAAKFEVSEEGGVVELEIKSNVDFSYKISDECKEWVSSVSTKAYETHKLSFMVAENTDIEKRNGRITIISNEFKEIVEIYQDGATPSLVLTENEYTLTSSEQVIKVELKSNVNVKMSIPSSCKWVYEEATKSVSTNTYYLVVEKNESYDDRAVEIVFSNKANGLREVVRISQSANETIIIPVTEYTVNSNGENFTVKVESSIDYDINIVDAWISEVETKAIEEKTHTFAAESLPDSLDLRTGQIQFVHPESGVSVTVSVAQYRALLLDKTNITLVEGDADVINVSFAIEEQTLVWSSSDTNVVEVDSEGNLTAVNPGYATVTVKTEDGVYSANCSVTVQDINDLVYLEFGYTYNVSYGDGYVASGSQLVWFLNNDSSEDIYVTYLQVVDVKNGYEGNYMYEGSTLNAYSNKGWVITLGIPIKAPCLKVYFEYKGREYTHVCASPFQ